MIRGIGDSATTRGMHMTGGTMTPGITTLGDMTHGTMTTGTGDTTIIGTTTIADGTEDGAPGEEASISTAAEEIYITVREVLPDLLEVHQATEDHPVLWQDPAGFLPATDRV